MSRTQWLDDNGLVTLPTGARVRGRHASDTVSPADFALVLGDSPLPAWPHRHIRWRDFWIPSDRVQALDAPARGLPPCSRRRTRRSHLRRWHWPHRNRLGRDSHPRRPVTGRGRNLDSGQLPSTRRRNPLATQMAPDSSLTKRAGAWACYFSIRPFGATGLVGPSFKSSINGFSRRGPL